MPLDTQLDLLKEIRDSLNVVAIPAVRVAELEAREQELLARIEELEN